MKKLPLESQTMIIKLLNAHDIARLQQTCKGLNDLIKESVEIWKACLKRLCYVERLFWSSFNGLSTAAEYKNACTGVWRFNTLHRTAGHWSKSRHLPVTEYGEASLEEEDETAEDPRYVYDQWDGRHFKNRHPWIKNAYLVPGGRYLVTLDRTWMLVWDIGLPGRTVEPAVLAKHKLDGNLNGWRFKLLDVDIVSDYTALRIVLRKGFYGDIPPYIDPSQLPSDTRLVAFHRFEIRLPESGDHAIVMLGRLCVARTDNDEIKAAQCGHKVALEVSSGEILLWDTRRGGAFSMWKIPICSAFYVQQGYLFAITSEGVQVIDFAQSSWQSPIKNGLVDPRSVSPVQASIYHTYEYPVEVGIIGRVILPKSIPTSGTVEYELRVDKRWADTYEMHRFSHDFDPEEPSSSMICFLGTPDSGTDRSCQPVLRFDGANGDSGYIFSQIESDVSMAIYKKAELLAGSQKFRDPTSIMTPENVSTLVQEVHVCPFSGRAVFLWDRGLVEDVMLEIADYL